jgi:hypothetical protein
MVQPPKIQVSIYINQDQTKAKFVYDNKEEIYKIENMINHIFYLYDNKNYSVISIIYNDGKFLMEINKEIKNQNTQNRPLLIGLTIPEDSKELWVE